MKINEYQQQAMKTALYREQIARNAGIDLFIKPNETPPKDSALNLLCKSYVINGFIGEVGEFFEQPSIGELGGILWYTAAVATEYGVPMMDLFDVVNGETFTHAAPTINIDRVKQKPLDAATVLTLQLGNKWKKVLRDGKDWTPLGMIETILGYLIAYCETFENMSLQDAAEYNIQQLADRAKRGTIQGDGDER